MQSRLENVVQPLLVKHRKKLLHKEKTLKGRQEFYAIDVLICDCNEKCESGQDFPSRF